MLPPRQVHFADHSQGDIVTAEKIFRLNSGKAQHFRNLVESQICSQ